MRETIFLVWKKQVIPFPMSDGVKLALAAVNVEEVLFVAPSDPVRSGERETLEPPFVFEPPTRTYHVVGRRNDPADGPMNPVTPFGVAYPFVAPYGTDDRLLTEETGRRESIAAGPLGPMPGVRIPGGFPMFTPGMGNS